VPKASDFEVCISHQYSNFKKVGNLQSQLRIFESNKADELLVINTEKAAGPLNADFVRAIGDSIEVLSTPIMVGGGINSTNDASSLVDVGVDKLLCGISTLNHSLHTEIANLFGSQALSISIDYSVEPEGLFVGFTQRKHYTLNSFTALIRHIENSGAGEIILNRIDFDGARLGLDIETLQTALTVATVPIVIASGAGKPEHFIDAFESGADGIATGTYFAKMDQSPLQLRSRIFNAGVNIRS
jgi:cyclase